MPAPNIHRQPRVTFHDTSPRRASSTSVAVAATECFFEKGDDLLVRHGMSPCCVARKASTASGSIFSLYFSLAGDEAPERTSTCASAASAAVAAIRSRSASAGSRKTR